MFCSKAASSCPTVCFCWRDQDLLVPRRGHRHRVVVLAIKVTVVFRQESRILRVSESLPVQCVIVIPSRDGISLFACMCLHARRRYSALSSSIDWGCSR